MHFKHWQGHSASCFRLVLVHLVNEELFACIEGQGEKIKEMLEGHPFPSNFCMHVTLIDSNSDWQCMTLSDLPTLSLLWWGQTHPHSYSKVLQLSFFPTRFERQS